jgi:hypothetical protein
MAQVADRPQAFSAAVNARLGGYSVGASRDVSAVADLAGGEELAAAVVALWQRRLWVVVATNVGLRLARRARLMRGREHAFDWQELTGVRSGQQSVVMSFGEAEVRLLAAGPHDEFVRLVEEARGHLDEEERPSVGEIRAIAKRKLGRLMTFGLEATIDGLPDRLQPGERVERLAGASLDFSGLLVLTDRRLLLLDVALRQANERMWAVDRTEIRSADAVDGGLRVVLREGDALLTELFPPERRHEFAAVLSMARR